MREPMPRLGGGGGTSVLEHRVRPAHSIVPAGSVVPVCEFEDGPLAE